MRYFYQTRKQRKIELNQGKEWLKNTGIYDQKTKLNLK